MVTGTPVTTKRAERGARDAALLAAAIRDAGLSGRVVCLHSSFRSFGGAVESPGAVVEAFVDAGCTLLVPTFSWEAFAVAPPNPEQPRRNALRGFPVRRTQAEVYEPSSTSIDETEMGAVAASVVQRPDRVRGDHPLASFAALGPKAAALVEPQSPLRPFAPLRALVEHEGVVVLAGVGLDSCTLLHLAEQEAGRTPFVRWAQGDNGSMEAAVGGCSDGFHRLEPRFRRDLRHVDVGSSRWLVFDAATVLTAAVQAIEDNPELTRCDQPDCERCDHAIAGGPLG